MGYLQELLALGETMQLASKCGLGQSSPNAFVSIVKHFKDEIMGRGFVFKNPNETSACGCGESVAITPASPEALAAAEG